MVARWFPVPERGRAFGIMLAAAQVGGAISPLLVVPIQMRYGWRASFYVFGMVGVLWAILWYRWYRESAAEKPGVPQSELDEAPARVTAVHRTLPWGIAIRSWNFWITMAICFCYIYSFNFFITWFHTYLVKAHGFSEKQLLLSSLPFAVAGCANLAGGLASHLLVKRVGLKWGRCSLGVIGLSVSAIAAVAVIFAQGQIATLVLLSLTFGGITFQQPIMFAACLDIGGEYAGAIGGAMNTASQVGGLIASVCFGYIVARTGNYNLPFVPMAILLAIGAVLWLRLDPNEHLTHGRLPVTAVAAVPGD